MDYHKLNGHLHKLQRSPLFSGVEPEELNSLLRLTHKRCLHSQQIIGWQGDPCGEFYYLIDGYVKLRSENLHGKRHTIGVVRPGEIFALEAMFSGDGYTATMETIKDSEILAFPTPQFLNFIKSRPVLFYKVLSALSRNVTQLITQVERQKVCTAKQKLVAYLLDHCDEESSDCSVSMPLRRTDLASMLGVTPETLCREMKKLKQDGLVSGNNGTVYVNDITRLQSVLSETPH